MSKQQVPLDKFPSYWSELFPEFKESEEFDETNMGIPYTFLADFGRFFMDRLRKAGETDAVVKKTFTVMNEMFNDPATDPEVINLMQIELCEILASSKKGLALATKLLSGKSLEYLNMARKWLNPVNY
ncbi:MAG: hypothetical protein A3G49_00725 [Candidatus Sungbacteria bacterium RIFCSPLOWO2_12_FULL_41_11]|uniref:DUF7674 domain-containing protein n=1 Tax=Candidatus Sungbacteria bacterium RIFCSPLOWO2_12_FULL_41_11 TaxID=1802286 RepID=A0A1G2LR31_9BACT|nr:MAG: hypothetical protein A2047_03765 [Omnitrophica bacterium GWA2_41_15]OHA13319.1 MAG: hypothetical protein A3G49_00725 [Candidatus Sungbacteria bacterium RIFCSPLOWO2_12_FULL_41_11]